MAKLRYKADNQKDAYSSSWRIWEVLGIRLWKIVWLLLFRYSPKILGRYWRVLLLKTFGAKIDWSVFVYSSAKVYVPWLLTMEGRACLGPQSEVYNLGPVHIKNRATISQFAYICNGTHDFEKPNLPLMVGNVTIEEDVFVGAKAVVLPGISIGQGAIVGACAVVTKNIEPWTVVGGNPAKFIKKRKKIISGL